MMLLAATAAVPVPSIWQDGKAPIDRRVSAPKPAEAAWRLHARYRGLHTLPPSPISPYNDQGWVCRRCASVGDRVSSVVSAQSLGNVEDIRNLYLCISASASTLSMCAQVRVKCAGPSVMIA
ncbi:hypothetical protein K431DRAFT_32425 [Polychaeton citri CBS 116435]|uniref:Uncharacterized protein n=1 Tax=Polychaeton citri CBS 116435 TaxID=1314669 RepID=A0A9P4UP60_9PEZI|nr:hypothetical protein K431DRAFT_32425 [Polychaeton citri CBS 116435]